jgi:hypothetical protein
MNIAGAELALIVFMASGFRRNDGMRQYRMGQRRLRAPKALSIKDLRTIAAQP